MTNYQDQAEELYVAMQLLLDDVVQYKSAVALLAVHSAIAYNDAVLEKLGIGVFSDSDHKRAYPRTLKVCAEKKIDHAGLRHLKHLLANKSDYSYNGAVDISAARAAAAKAERFQLWAYKNVLRGS